MQEFQKRVVAERDDLKVKLDALCKFFKTDTFSNLPEDEKHRLYDQQATMFRYTEILDDRINHFQ